MNISIHRWPPGAGTYADDPNTGTGVLVIDDESGYAVACISERSEWANTTIAKRRLRGVIKEDGERKELQSKIEGYVQRLAACNRTVDELDTLDAYRQNELHEERTARQLSDRDNQRLIGRVQALEEGLRTLRINGANQAPFDFGLVAKLLREV